MYAESVPYLYSRFVLTVFVAGPLMAWSVVGCSSSSSSSTPSDATDAATSPADANIASQDAGALADATSAMMDGTASASDDATTSPADAVADTTDALSAGDAHASAVDASAACKSYCTCMAMNCKSEIFGGGCLSECASQTTWDLPCRANMCSLVLAQPNNDHCTHAFGMVECLNE